MTTLPVKQTIEVTSPSTALLKAVSENNITEKQILHVKNRVRNTKGRLQLRFPIVFRDGYLLQYLLPLITNNKNINHLALGLTDHYGSGFYTINSILNLTNIIKFDLRINNLQFAPPQFFKSLSNAHLQILTIRLDSISDYKMLKLCRALTQSTSISQISFRFASLSNISAQYLAQYFANKPIINLHSHSSPKNNSNDNSDNIGEEQTHTGSESESESERDINADAEREAVTFDNNNSNSNNSADRAITSDADSDPVSVSGDCDALSVGSDDALLFKSCSPSFTKMMEQLDEEIVNVSDEMQNENDRGTEAKAAETIANTNSSEEINHHFQTLRLSIDTLSIEQQQIIAQGIGECSGLIHLDITDCQLECLGMTILLQHLPNCKQLKTLSIGNNGKGSMLAFFKMLDQQIFSQLICSESHSYNVEFIDLNLISTAISNAKHLESIQLPLFIFNETDTESLKLFAHTLCHKMNLHTLQLFPLFEHLDNSNQELNPLLCSKITHLLVLLFTSLAEQPQSETCLKRLYIEMIGAESDFFNLSVANAFELFLLTNRNIQQIYLPFCYLIDLNPNILHAFSSCKQLIAIKDDNLDMNFLLKIEKMQQQEQAQQRCNSKHHKQKAIQNNNNSNTNNNHNSNSNGYMILPLDSDESDDDDDIELISDSISNCKCICGNCDSNEDYSKEYWFYAWNFMGEERQRSLFEYKRYHQIVHQQCSLNIARSLKPHVAICLAQLIASFVGFNPDPEKW